MRCTPTRRGACAPWRGGASEPSGRHASPCGHGSRASSSACVRLADTSVSWPENVSWTRKGAKSRGFLRRARSIDGPLRDSLSTGSEIEKSRGNCGRNDGPETVCPHLWRLVWRSCFSLQIGLFFPRLRVSVSDLGVSGNAAIVALRTLDEGAGWTRGARR